MEISNYEKQGVPSMKYPQIKGDVPHLKSNRKMGMAGDKG